MSGSNGGGGGGPRGSPHHTFRKRNSSRAVDFPKETCPQHPSLIVLDYQSPPSPFRGYTEAVTILRRKTTGRETPRPSGTWTFSNSWKITRNVKGSSLLVGVASPNRVPHSQFRPFLLFKAHFLTLSIPAAVCTSLFLNGVIQCETLHWLVWTVAGGLN